MKTFEIEIVEVLSKVVKVKATSSEEAVEKVKAMHENSEIVLDWKDYDNMPVYQDIKIINKCFNCDKKYETN